MKKLMIALLFLAGSVQAADKAKDTSYLQDEIISPVGRYQLANVHQTFIYLKDGKQVPGEDQTVAKIDTMTGAVYLLRYVDNEFVWVETSEIPINANLFSEIPLSEIKTK